MVGLNGGESAAVPCSAAGCGRVVAPGDAWECVPDCGAFCSRECHRATVAARLSSARAGFGVEPFASMHDEAAAVLADRLLGMPWGRS